MRTLQTASLFSGHRASHPICVIRFAASCQVGAAATDGGGVLYTILIVTALSELALG